MATVKTVLVKGRSNRSGKFPLVVQVLHKRRKKVVYTGFSISDTLFDPVKGRVIDGGENTLESIRRINHRCESISRVLLKVSDCSTTSCVFDFLLRCTPL